VFILLDENLLSKKLKKPLLDTGHIVQNVDEMGWRGVKDRELLALAQAHPFDVFVTADKNLPYQQNLRGLTLQVIVLDASSTRPDYLLPLIARISYVLQSLAPGSVTLINDAGEVTPFNPSS
jgi:predicted nuclease of predicted toxin-antitoxin system